MGIAKFYISDRRHLLMMMVIPMTMGFLLRLASSIKHPTSYPNDDNACSHLKIGFQFFHIKAG